MVDSLFQRKRTACPNHSAATPFPPWHAETATTAMTISSSSGNNTPDGWDVHQLSMTKITVNSHDVLCSITTFRTPKEHTNKASMFLHDPNLHHRCRCRRRRRRLHHHEDVVIPSYVSVNGTFITCLHQQGQQQQQRPISWYCKNSSNTIPMSLF